MEEDDRGKTKSCHRWGLIRCSVGETRQLAVGRERGGGRGDGQYRWVHD